MFLVSYEQTAIKYVWKNDEDTLRKSPSLTSLNAYLISNQTIECTAKASWRGENSIKIINILIANFLVFILLLVSLLNYFQNFLIYIHMENQIIQRVSNYFIK